MLATLKYYSRHISFAFVLNRENREINMSRQFHVIRHLQQTHLEGITHEQTIICRELFAGHGVVSRPMKRKE